MLRMESMDFEAAGNLRWAKHLETLMLGHVLWNKEIL